MARKKQYKARILLLLGAYLLIVGLFIASILVLPNITLRSQKEYIKKVEQSMFDFFAVSEEAVLEEKFKELRKEYPLEIAVYTQEEIVFQTLPGVPVSELQSLLPDKSKIAEIEGVIEGKDKNYFVWYTIYQMPLQSYFDPIFIFQISIIGLISILLITLFLNMRKQLLAPLKQVKQSIAKLNEFDLENIEIQTDDVINKDMTRFVSTLNTRIKAVSRNHTELEYALQLERERLENLMDISRGIVHDLKTPVHQILLENDLILSEAVNLSADANLIVNHNINKLDAVIQNINKALNLMSTNVDDMIEGLEEYDVILQLDDIIKDFRITIESKQIYLDLDIEEEIEIKQNKVMMHLIIHNMLSNALKYAPNESDVHIDVFKHDKLLEIVIENAATELDIMRITKSEDLFLTELDKSDNGDKKYTYSTGNGLYLIKELAILANGMYILDTNENENWVRVTVQIPLNK